MFNFVNLISMYKTIVLEEFIEDSIYSDDLGWDANCVILGIYLCLSIIAHMKTD